MRVGLVIYGSLETLSGGYIYDRFLVDFLREKGDHVEVISLPVTRYAGQLGHNIFPSQLSNLVNLKLDVLLQDELCHPSLVLVNRSIRRSRSYPVVSIVHHLRISEPDHARGVLEIYRAIEFTYLREVDGFIFNSKTTRAVVEQAVGLHHASVVAQPGANRLGPALGEDDIAARALQASPLRLIFLGNVIPRKGLEILLAALADLPEEDLELTVIGSLDMESAYAQTMIQSSREIDRPQRITFRGPLNDEQLGIEMHDHHLMVLPSFYEGFGIAYLEAMGFGLPVVGTTAGAAPEVITPEVDGFLIPPGDSNALANILSDLNRDRVRLAEMGVAALHRYQRGPHWRNTGEKIRSFLQDVCIEERFKGKSI